jgi:methionyl-tRNA formyltransferase
VKPRLVFMGSPEAAVPALRAATRVGEVVGVFSQPDRPAGRGRRLCAPPVATVARELGLPVHQPASVRKPETHALLAGLRPDVIVVVAYGRILPPAVLTAAPRGCLNVHFSLLPRHRGAAPVAHAILAGDDRTGVTLMQLDEGLDTGPTLAQRTVEIGAEETAGELTARLAEVGAELLEVELPRWVAGELAAQPQPPTGATLAPPLDKCDGAIRWDRPAAEVARRIRAVTPWPGAFGYLEGRRIIVHRARLLAHLPTPGAGVVLTEARRLAVGTADGCVELLELQREGGKRTDACCFLAGCCPERGAKVCPEPPATGG